jgi:hypothetical protein
MKIGGYFKGIKCNFPIYIYIYIYIYICNLILLNNIIESFHSPNYSVFSSLLPSLFSSFLTENLTEFIKKTLNSPRETKQVLAIDLEPL